MLAGFALKCILVILGGYIYCTVLVHAYLYFYFYITDILPYLPFYTRSSLSTIHACVSINKQLKIIYEIVIVIQTIVFFCLASLEKRKKGLGVT